MHFVPRRVISWGILSLILGLMAWDESAAEITFDTLGFENTVLSAGDTVTVLFDSQAADRRVTLSIHALRTQGTFTIAVALNGAEINSPIFEGGESDYTQVFEFPTSLLLQGQNSVKIIGLPSLESFTLLRDSSIEIDSADLQISGIRLKDLGYVRQVLSDGDTISVDFNSDVPDQAVDIIIHALKGKDLFQVTVLLNGARRNSSSFSGGDPDYEEAISFPTALLNQGQNTLQIIGLPGLIDFQLLDDSHIIISDDPQEVPGQRFAELGFVNRELSEGDTVSLNFDSVVADNSVTVGVHALKSGGQYQIAVRLNGAQLSSASFTGGEFDYTEMLTFPTSLLLQGENTVDIIGLPGLVPFTILHDSHIEVSQNSPVYSGILLRDMGYSRRQVSDGDTVSLAFNSDKEDRRVQLSVHTLRTGEFFSLAAVLNGAQINSPTLTGGEFDFVQDFEFPSALLTQGDNTLSLIGLPGLAPIELLEDSHLRIEAIQIAVAQDSIHFGENGIAQSTDYSLTVSDTSSVGISISNVQITGVNAQDFSATPSEFNLDSGESQQVTVTFLPTSAGAKDAVLNLHHDAPESTTPVSIPLSGTGIETVSSAFGPITIESIGFHLADTSFVSQTDIFDVVLNISNTGTAPISDVLVSAYLDHPDSSLAAEYHPFIAPNDGDDNGRIDLIDPGPASIIVARIEAPRTWDRHIVGVSGISVGDLTFNATYEDTVSVYYVEDSSQPYSVETDGFGFSNPAAMSFSSFLDFFGQGELRLPIYSGWAQWRGLGVGMATSSNLFFTTPSTKPQALADSTVSSMKITDAVVSEEIVRNQVNHIGPLLAGLTVFSEESVFESDMNRLLSGVSGPISDNNPVVMVLGKSGSPGDYHAVSAFKVAENHSSGTATIFLYDSESPGLATTATVDLGTNAFEYGNFDQAALISQTAITLSQTTSELFHDSVLGPFKDAFVSLIGQESMDFIGHASPVRMLITDPSTGNRTGFVDGTSLVNEIALAQVIEVPNPGGNPAFAFYLPTGPAYQITFIGFEAGSMYIDIIRPNSGTDARGVTFQEVAVDSGTVVTIADLSTFIETDATISIDFDGDGAVDSQVAADAVQDLVVEQPTGIVGGGRTDIPDSFALKSNRPNPFNPTTRISFEVASESHITLTIYNILGQEIVTLVDGAHTPGVYDVIWNGTDGYGKVAPSGVYFYRLLSSSGYNRTRRMLLLK